MIEPKDLKDIIKRTQESVKTNPESSAVPQLSRENTTDAQSGDLKGTDVVAEVLALESIPKNIASTDLETQIVTLAIQGETPIRIAKSLELSIKAVRGFLIKPEVVEYLEKMRDATATYSQLLTQDLLTKIIEARLEELEENGESMANFTEKDTLEVIRELQNVSNNIQKNKQKDQDTNVFLQIYNQIT